MLNTLLRIWIQALLWLRYRVRVRGLEAVLARGRTGILFLPNHPALIDPLIVLVNLHRHFAPRALADQDQVNRFFIRWLARRAGVRAVPDVVTHGATARARIAEVLRECGDGLRRGENLVFYPSGHLYRSRYEDLRGNSGVELLLRQAPRARVVLVRTRGLWGSSFSLAHGHMPNVRRRLLQHVLHLLGNFIFFTPRREVTIELHEPADLPRGADRGPLNAFLEGYYNDHAPPALYVPYTIWERGGARPLPDPAWGQLAGALADVPPATRQLVLAHLAELCGVPAPRDEDRLAQDLGLDSLAKAELVLWLGREFGFVEGNVDALQTVGDVLLAARGQAVVTRPVELQPAPAAWFRPRQRQRLSLPDGRTITEVFLDQARRGPDRICVADQLRGAKSYRDLITAILVLRPYLARLDGQRIGLMLPASVGATVLYLTALFAGKTPVMVNWTTGTRNMTHLLELVGVRHVLTSAALVGRLAAQGLDLGGLRDRLLPVEELAKRIGLGTKMAAAASARLNWTALERAAVAETAVVLMTSGSESLPKAVPLTHANILANIRDILHVLTVHQDDVLLGILPPFHSFGLTVTMLTPLLGGARVVFHANPTEAWVLARLVATYGATLLCGTPTFLSGIARAATPDQLAHLRLLVTGAEKCPPHVYRLLAERCPGAVVLEGYGVSECSPVVAVGRQENPRPGTIGQVLPSLEYAIVDVGSGRRAEPGATGLLLLRGPTVFPGYLGGETATPFVEFEGKSWYRTGDLVSADQDDVLTFRGRLRRFIKLGGEMISLPAIEAAIEPHYAGDADEGPVVAVEATPREDHPEIVLFTTRHIDRATANRHVREAGLSALHNVTRVVRLDQIPLLGTGKTDYQALKRRLEPSADP